VQQGLERGRRPRREIGGVGDEGRARPLVKVEDVVAEMVQAMDERRFDDRQFGGGQRPAQHDGAILAEALDRLGVDQRGGLGHCPLPNSGSWRPVSRYDASQAAGTREGKSLY
jgi:nucleoside-diphosphate-sugar epimerase